MSDSKKYTPSLPSYATPVGGNKNGVTKKFRPQHTLEELYVIEAGLAAMAGLEAEVPEEFLVPDMVFLHNLLKKVAAFRYKAEVGYAAPAYMVTGTKPGRLSAADIIRLEAAELAEAEKQAAIEDEEYNGEQYDEEFSSNAETKRNTKAEIQKRIAEKRKQQSPKEHNLFMYNRYTSSYGSSITSAMSGDSPMSEEDIYAALTHKLEAGETLEEEEKRLFNKVQMQQFMSPE